MADDTNDDGKINLAQAATATAATGVLGYGGATLSTHMVADAKGMKDAEDAFYKAGEGVSKAHGEAYGKVIDAAGLPTGVLAHHVLPTAAADGTVLTDAQKIENQARKAVQDVITARKVVVDTALTAKKGAELKFPTIIEELTTKARAVTAGSSEEKILNAAKAIAGHDEIKAIEKAHGDIINGAKKLISDGEFSKQIEQLSKEGGFTNYMKRGAARIRQNPVAFAAATGGLMLGSLVAANWMGLFSDRGDSNVERLANNNGAAPANGRGA